jgi:hypothetical protein
VYTAATFEKATLVCGGEDPLPLLFATGRIGGIGRVTRTLAAKILPDGTTIEIGLLLAGKFFVARANV